MHPAVRVTDREVVAELQGGDGGVHTALQHGVAPLIHKGVKTQKEGVDKLVFVGLDRLVAVHVQDFARRDDVALHLGNQVGMLGEVTHRAAGDIPREFDRKHLFFFTQLSLRVADNRVEDGQCLFHRPDPGLVQRPQEVTTGHRQLSVTVCECRKADILRLGRFFLISL